MQVSRRFNAGLTLIELHVTRFCPSFAAKPVNTMHALPSPAEGIGRYH
jgi:hypothetical protein